MTHFKRRTDEEEEDKAGKDMIRPNRRYEKFSPKRSPKHTIPMRDESPPPKMDPPKKLRAGGAEEPRRPKEEWIIPEAEKYFSKKAKKAPK